MSDKTKQIILIQSAIAALVIVTIASLAFRAQDNTRTGTTQPPRDVRMEELLRSNGKMGQPCLVAVDGTVYKIDGFSLWQDGQHTTSNGEAYCGADMSEAITKSPHGKSKLQLLETVGPLVN